MKANIGDRAKRSDPIMGFLATQGMVGMYYATDDDDVFAIPGIKAGDRLAGVVDIGEAENIDPKDFLVRTGSVEYIGSGDAPLSALFLYEKWGSVDGDKRG